MILYKYMSTSVAELVLSSDSIGFSNPDKFNDPYELKAGYPPNRGNPISEFIGEIQAFAKQDIWSRTSGVLCLTRNPLNSLMWSHYGDEHKGVVIGVDVKAAGFMDTERCLIPAQFGNIVYTHTRPTHELMPSTGVTPISIGHTFHYPIGHEEKLQRLFLQKPACWSYEEEVRIVKCLSDMENGQNKSGHFKEIDTAQKKIYCYQLPPNSIKEIYFGLRNEMQDKISEHKDIYQGLRKFACKMSNNTWDINAIEIQ